MGKPISTDHINDDVAGDLLAMFIDSGLDVTDRKTKALLMKLSSYIVRRDATVYNHAYQLGKKRP